MPTFTPAVPGQIAPAADFNELQDAIEQLTAFDEHSASHAITVGQHHSSEDTSSGAYAVSLPSASSFGAGNMLMISKDDISANELTITPDGSDLIDNQSSVSLYGRVAIQLVSTGLNWIVTAGKDVINTPLRPRWFGFSPAASGSTNSSALATAMAAAASAGLRLELDYGYFNLAEDFVFLKTVDVVGQGSGMPNAVASSGIHPTQLYFAAGKGVIATDIARKSSLQHVALSSAENSSGSAVAIRWRASRGFLSDVYIEKFGSHGVFIDTSLRTPSAATYAAGVATLTQNDHRIVVGEQIVTSGFTASAWNGAKVITAVTANTISFAAGSIVANASVIGTFAVGNANLTKVEGTRVVSNGGDGHRTEGADSNVVQFYNCDGSSNARGFALYGSKATVIGAHASGNTLTITDGVTTIAVDYFDGSSSNTWINPYSEGSKAFHIDTSISNDGVLRSTSYAAPTVWSGLTGSPVANAAAAHAVAWDITNPQGVAVRGYKFKDPSGTVEWRWSSGQSATDQVQFRDQTNNRALLTFLTGAAGSARMTLFDGMDVATGTSTGTKWGINASAKQAWWGKTPVVQPASANQAASVTTAATNTTPYGFTTAAQADGIVTLLNQMRSDLVTIGLIKGAA